MATSRKHPGIRPHHGAQQLRYWGTDGERHTETFDRISDALDRQREVKTDMRRGTWLDPARGRETLAEFYARWRAHAIETGRPAERTLIGYSELWRLYLDPALGRRRLASITRADVEDVVRAAGERSPWRAHDVLKVLRMLLNRAMAEEIIGRNPASRVPAPAPELQEPWVLTPADVERLADAAGERWRALVLLAAYSSLRWSELVALRVERLDLLRRRVRVEEKITEHGRLIAGAPKTRQSRRSVSIPEFVVVELAEHIRRFPPSPEGLIFTASKGGPIRRPAFRRLVWVPAVARAGLPGFPFKNLRHTGASLAIAAGANPLLVAARLGHTSTRMVEKHYVSLFEGLDAEIGERLGTMRQRRESESERLRPGTNGDQMGTRANTGSAEVIPLPPKTAVDQRL